MIYRTYKCDLCGEMFKDNDERLHGIYWSFKNYFTEHSTINSEHHLCDCCLQSATEMWERIQGDRNFEEETEERNEE